MAWERGYTIRVDDDSTATMSVRTESMRWGMKPDAYLGNYALMTRIPRSVAAQALRDMRRDSDTSRELASWERLKIMRRTHRDTDR